MRRLLTLTCAMVLVDTVFYAALVPLLPYFVGELGLSKALAGVLSGAFGAGVLLGGLPGGYAAARLGVKPAALMGLALLSGTSLAFGFAGGAWELVALRLAGGFGSALSWVAAFTWLVAHAPEERRGQMIGTLMSAAVAGALLGPALGGAAATLGVAPVFALVCAVGLAVAGWAWVTPAPGPSPAWPPLAEVFAALLRREPATGLAFIGFPPLLFGVLAVLAPLELARLGWSAAAVGVTFLVAALFEATIHPLIGHWSDRSGYRPPILAGLLASLGILLALPWASTAPLIALLVVLAGIAFNAPLVPGTALFSREAEKAGIGAALAFGVINLAWASGNAVGSSLGGALADLGGDAVAYLTLACLVAVSFQLSGHSCVGATAPGPRNRSHEGGSLIIKVAALAGIVGPVLFALVTVALTVIQFDFMLGIGWHPLEDPAGAWPSGLSLGPYGWAQSSSFAVSGLLLMCFALGLHRGMAEDSRIGPALLALCGLAMALLAFETDPISRASPRTPHGWVHDLAFVLFVASLVPAFFFLWRRMVRDPLWRNHGRYTLITGLLATPLFLLPGPAYYLSLVLILAWLETLAIQLWIVHGRRPVPSRKFRDGAKS